jgi:hypothetical protein
MFNSIIPNINEKHLKLRLNENLYELNFLMVLINRNKNQKYISVFH